MHDGRIEAFARKFDEMDQDKDGKMKPREFHNLYCELEGRECHMSESEVMFRGIDINGSGTVTKDEFLDLVRAIINDDRLYTYKLIFRAFDKNRSGALEVHEVVDIFKYCGKTEATIADGEAAMERATGKKKGKMTFAMLYRELSGRDIDKDTDPYDGKLGSQCCLII